MMYSLPKLQYSYGALEPYIDARTMEIHYTKHHQAYVNNLNTVLGKYHTLSEMKIMDLLCTLDKQKFERKDKMTFRNNAGGHINHSFFWSIMGPKKELDEKLQDRINRTYGSINEFKKIFTQTAISHFGSGWVWLVDDEKGDLQTYSLPNQDSPYLLGHTPCIALDVWEHAYYLNYQNRRADYIEAWWNVVKII